ncbi:hypothetical protein EVAR_51977_1 [Eumeta japonica]|uniref:Uncharacterized protein n=1 Tax=Eumeta variegata TaxID=151549 RepID=A0A4C1Y386_EUMVA|nr:hypothetical protein EVAR_51977_1 [Eumeta japonica]
MNILNKTREIRPRRLQTRSRVLLSTRYEIDDDEETYVNLGAESFDQIPIKVLHSLRASGRKSRRLLRDESHQRAQVAQGRRTGLKDRVSQFEILRSWESAPGQGSSAPKHQQQPQHTRSSTMAVIAPRAPTQLRRQSFRRRVRAGARGRPAPSMAGINADLEGVVITRDRRGRVGAGLGERASRVD